MHMFSAVQTLAMKNGSAENTKRNSSMKWYNKDIKSWPEDIQAMLESVTMQWISAYKSDNCNKQWENGKSPMYWEQHLKQLVATSEITLSQKVLIPRVDHCYIHKQLSTDEQNRATVHTRLLISVDKTHSAEIKVANSKD